MSYELHYYAQDDPNSTYTEILAAEALAPGADGMVTASHTLQHLRPYLEHVGMVRALVTHGSDGEAAYRTIVSNFSNSVTFQTQEDGKVNEYLLVLKIWWGLHLANIFAIFLSWLVACIHNY